MNITSLRRKTMGTNKQVLNATHKCLTVDSQACGALTVCRTVERGGGNQVSYQGARSLEGPRRK